jgi:hypothetical protein
LKLVWYIYVSEGLNLIFNATKTWRKINGGLRDKKCTQNLLIYLENFTREFYHGGKGKAQTNLIEILDFFYRCLLVSAG